MLGMDDHCKNDTWLFLSCARGSGTGGRKKVGRLMRKGASGKDKACCCTVNRMILESENVHDRLRLLWMGPEESAREELS